MKSVCKVRLNLFGTLALALLAAACGAADNRAGAGATANGNSNGAAAAPAASASPAPAGHTSGEMMKSSPGAAGAPYDLQFLDTMTAHHEGAVRMAEMAKQKAAHPELRGMASKMVEMQRGEIAQMKSWREGWYKGAPQAVNMEMPGMSDPMKGMDMGHMESAQGNDFDHMFLDMMVPHHGGAVTMAKQALERAEHAEIKTMARKIIDDQEKEVVEMRRLREVWGGTGK